MISFVRTYFPMYDGFKYSSCIEQRPRTISNIEHSRFYLNKDTMREVESLIEDNISILVLTRNEVNWDDGRYYKPTITSVVISFNSDSNYEIYKKIMDELREHTCGDDPLLYTNMTILDNYGHFEILHEKYNEKYERSQILNDEYNWL